MKQFVIKKKKTADDPNQNYKPDMAELISQISENEATNEAISTQIIKRKKYEGIYMDIFAI